MIGHDRSYVVIIRNVYECFRVIFMDAPTDTILERMTLRSVDPVTGERWVTRDTLLYTADNF